MEHLVDSVSGGAALFKVGNRIISLFYSKGLLALLGYTENDERQDIKEDAASVVDEKDRDMVLQRIRHCVDNHQMLDVVFRVRHKQGHLIWVKMDGRVLGEHEGFPILYAMFHDYTSDMKRNERELQEFMALNLHTKEVLLFNVSKGWYRRRSGQAIHNGYMPEEGSMEAFISKVLPCLVSQRDREIYERTLSRESLLKSYGEGHTSIRIDMPFFTQNKDIRWLRTNLQLRKNPDSNDIEGLLGISDIDEQVRTRRILQNIANDEYDYIAVIDITKKTISFCFISSGLTRKFKAFLEIPCDERSYDEFCQFVTREWIYSDEQDIFLEKTDVRFLWSQINKSPVYSFTVRTCHHNTISFKQLKYSCMDAERNKILLKQVDVTEIAKQEQGKLQEELRLRHALTIRLERERALKHQAVRANEAKTKFLSNISHDMRTPLNGIIGFTRLALRSTDMEEREEYLKKIDLSGTFLLNLINKTLELSKIENGKLVLQMEPVDTDIITDSVVSVIQQAADTKKIKFVVHTEKQQHACILTDALRTEQILLNLLSNAVKFTPAQGKIELDIETLRVENDRIYNRYVIRDTGIGIEDTFLPHIFEPFMQENVQRGDNISGTGLGLSIVEKLVTSMGGKISVQSQSGTGTEFIVLLDFEIVEKPAHTDVDTAPATLDGKWILLCEDHPLNTELIKLLLEKQKARVICAKNGKEGIDIFCKSSLHMFDAILMDLRMPVMDGITAATAIRRLDREDAAQIPIIAVTADAFDEALERTRSAGMNGHISKPIDAEVLYDVLMKNIQKH